MWHECSETYHSKSLFSCHLPSAFFLTQKNNAHVIWFEYSKAPDLFFWDRVVLRRPSEKYELMTCDLQPIRRNTESKWKTWICSMTPSNYLIFKGFIRISKVCHQMCGCAPTMCTHTRTHTHKATIKSEDKSANLGGDDCTPSPSSRSIDYRHRYIMGNPWQ